MDSYRALVAVLTPSESKRLIAKGVAALPEVKNAFENGRLIICNGTTNAYIAEELLGIPVPKVRYAAGAVAEGRLWVSDAKQRILPYASVNGKRVETAWQEVLKDFDADDVLLKGANAVDHHGIPGVLASSPDGGTVGASYGLLAARGSHLIVPVGLEKLIPSVMDAAHHTGSKRIARGVGFAAGLIPLPTAQVITEIHALETLFEVEAWHVASGGITGSEGAVVLTIEGEQKEVDKAFEFVEKIKGEPPVKPE